MLKTMLFLHIPRSGGTTLRRILAKYYAGEAQVRLNKLAKNLKPEEFVERAEALKRNEPLFVNGHPDRFFCYWYYIQAREHVKVVLIREPVSRVLSQYRYFQEVQNTRLSLKAYLQRFSRLQNYQTRVLATMASFDSCHYYVDSPSVEKALHNLQVDNVVFGLTEEFDLTLALINQKLGLGITRYKAFNKTKSFEVEDKEGLAMLRELYAKDIDLYARAKREFYDRVSLLDSDILGFEGLEDEQSYCEFELTKTDN